MSLEVEDPVGLNKSNQMKKVWYRVFDKFNMTYTWQTDIQHKLPDFTWLAVKETPSTIPMFYVLSIKVLIGNFPEWWLKHEAKW